VRIGVILCGPAATSPMIPGVAVLDGGVGGEHASSESSLIGATDCSARACLLILLAVRAGALLTGSDGPFAEG